MVKHTQTIRRQIVFDHFVGLALKGLSSDHLLTGYEQLSY